MRDGYLRGSLSRPATRRQMDVLAAYVAAGGSVTGAAQLVGIRPSTLNVISPTSGQGQGSQVSS